VLCACAVGVQRHVTGSVVWNQTSIVAKQGDNLALVCTVHGAAFFDVVRLTLTPRSVAVADAGSSIRWTISDNDAMKYEFAQLSRYRIDYHITGVTATVRLNITGMSSYVRACTHARVCVCRFPCMTYTYVISPSTNGINSNNNNSPIC